MVCYTLPPDKAGDAFAWHWGWLQRADQAPWGPTLVINCSLELLAFEWSLLAGHCPPSTVHVDVVAYSSRTAWCVPGVIPDLSNDWSPYLPPGGRHDDDDIYLDTAHSTGGG